MLRDPGDNSRRADDESNAPRLYAGSELRHPAGSGRRTGSANQAGSVASWQAYKSNSILSTLPKQQSPGLSLALAMTPILFLVTLLGCSVYLFGADSSYGANQVALVLATGVTALVGLSWAQIQAGIIDGISIGLGPILILLAVGMLIGTWILSGTVPAMIYYGVEILDPGIFFAATTAICAIVAISIRSSWTVAGTLGIGLMGIAGSFNLSPAVIAWNTCGAYMSATLGMATLHCAPFAFFNLLCPLIAVICGFAGIGLKPAEATPPVPEES